MIVESTSIPGLLLIKPTVFEDERGYFFESFNHQRFAELSGTDVVFVQDNQSKSNKGVLRGLHFQNPPYAQDKLVRVIKGSVLDVAVDIRKNSPTYGKYYSVELSEQNKWMLFIPKGFAHGFSTLEDNTVFFYKCSNYYNKQSEGCIAWDDLSINIDWGKPISPVLSPKDKEGQPFASFNSPFS